MNLSILLWRCVPDAPHSNPLDPFYKDSGEENFNITGYIYHKNVTTLPVDSCLILLTPGESYALSDAAGRFTFFNITERNYQLFFSKTGYENHTLSILTDTLTSEPLFVYLNGFPKIRDISLSSQFIDQWYPDPFFSVTVNLIAEDPNGPADIQETWLQIPDLNMVKLFNRSSRTDSFHLRLPETEFPSEDIFSVIGKDIFIELTDESDARTVEGPFFIHRIIDTSPVPLSPIGLATVGSQPVLEWQNYTANFYFEFDIQVFFILAGVPTLIHTRTGIPSSELQYGYPNPLSPGQYYWVVIVRDQLGNISRSREASFQVQ
ncbi:MAG: carboxypeptidase regulatory-like domain-containing protein [Calditrichaeota bacterium]|nr:MAG: carboxypeptidase regulatory-like domain-containing protein [Calditrichota bacterium]